MLVQIGVSAEGGIHHIGVLGHFFPESLLGVLRQRVEKGLAFLMHYRRTQRYVCQVNILNSERAEIRVIGSLASGAAHLVFDSYDSGLFHPDPHLPAAAAGLRLLQV